MLSDEEVDEILNQAEKKIYHNNKTSKSIDNSLYSKNRAYNKNMNLVYNYPKQKIIYKKVPNNIIYQNNVKKTKQYYENRIIQNRVLTPDKKKIVYPLTPDYQIRKKKNNNNIINYQYTPILEAHPKKIINYQYNNYTPIKSNNPQNVIKYQPPKKVVKANGKNYYLMPIFSIVGGFLSASSWLIYGTFDFEINVIIPNALGVLFALIQIVVYFYLWKT